MSIYRPEVDMSQGNVIRSVSAWFPGTPEQVKEARRFVHAALQSGMNPHAEDSRLPVSEVFTNGVLHSPLSKTRGILVSVTYDASSAWVSIRDPGRGKTLPTVPLTKCAEETPSGRGLCFLGLFTEEWGWTKDEATGEVEVFFRLGPPGL